MIPERRAETRRPLRYLVRFDDAGDMRLAFTADLSSGGLFLKTRYPPPPGAGLRLLIRTARGPSRRRGVVVWSRYNFLRPDDPHASSGAGIRFLDPVTAVACDA